MIARMALRALVYSSVRGLIKVWPQSSIAASVLGAVLVFAAIGALGLLLDAVL